MSEWESPEAIRASATKLQKEKADIERRITAFEESCEVKLDAKSEKALNSYKVELTAARAINQRNTETLNRDEESHIQRVKDKYEKLYQQLRKDEEYELDKVRNRFDTKKENERHHHVSREKYFLDIMASVTPKAPPKPERIIRDEMRLREVTLQLDRLDMFLSNYELANKPNFVPTVMIPAIVWKPSQELEEEAKRVRTLRPPPEPEF
jgi:hypothetical protein